MASLSSGAFAAEIESVDGATWYVVVVVLLSRLLWEGTVLTRVRRKTTTRRVLDVLTRASAECAGRGRVFRAMQRVYWGACTVQFHTP